MVIQVCVCTESRREKGLKRRCSSSQTFAGGWLRVHSLSAHTWCRTGRNAEGGWWWTWEHGHLCSPAHPARSEAAGWHAGVLVLLLWGEVAWWWESSHDRWLGLHQERSLLYSDSGESPERSLTTRMKKKRKWWKSADSVITVHWYTVTDVNFKLLLWFYFHLHL